MRIQSKDTMRHVGGGDGQLSSITQGAVDEFDLGSGSTSIPIKLYNWTATGVDGSVEQFVTVNM